MIYPLAAAFLLLSIVLLLAGTIGRKNAALYALKCVWLPGLLLAAYLTLDAWRGRSFGDNWAALGVLIFVLPYTGAVLFLGILELILLRGRHGPHAKGVRIVTAVFVALLVIFSVVGVLSA